MCYLAAIWDNVGHYESGYCPAAVAAVSDWCDILGAQNCLACKAERIRTVFIISQEGVPPGQEGHNIVYAHAVVGGCLTCGIGQVEVLAHDCWDFEEVWDCYEWYLLGAADFQSLRQRLVSCPNPLSAACGCPAHAVLRTSVTSLPSASWTTGLEHAAHIHHIHLEPSERALWFKVLPAEPPAR